jgi:PAS domain S-box-containing protein
MRGPGPYGNARVPIPAKTPEAALNFARAIIDTSHLPLLLFDDEARVICASRSFSGAFGIAADQTTGKTLSELGRGEWNIPQLRLLLENALLGGPQMGDYETDFKRPAMQAHRLAVNVQTVVQDHAQPPRVLMTITDVTQARQTERMNITLLLEKDGLLREKAILLEEMQHRVANSLQIIASVLLLKARAVKSDEIRVHLHDAHDRVMSLAAVQQHLQFSLGDVDVGPYLTKLCQSLSSSMIRGGRPITLDVRADEATVSSHEAVSLGLIVTELVINALKHAFREGRGGAIVVGYHLGEPGWTLSVTDDGVGRPIRSAAVKAGLGTSIVDGLAKQLGAKVAISDAAPGARIEIVNIGPVDPQ